MPFFGLKAPSAQLHAKLDRNIHIHLCRAVREEFENGKSCECPASHQDVGKICVVSKKEVRAKPPRFARTAVRTGKKFHNLES